MLGVLLEDFSHTSWALVAVALIVGAVSVLSRLLGISWRGLRGPGPWGIPILGYYPFLRGDYHIQLMDYTKKYGDPYLLSIGGKLYLHLASHRSLREVFVTKSDCFQNRSSDFSIFEFIFGKGIFFAEDEAWRVWRRFLGKSMRELGIGPKEQLRGPILDAVEATLDVLRNSKGSPVDMNDLLLTQCVEVVRRLILGNEVSQDISLKLSRVYSKTLFNFADGGFLLCGDIARRLLLPRYEGFKYMFEGKKEMESILNNILNDHKSNFDGDHPQDFIDMYLCEKKSLEEKGDPQAKYFTDEAFIGTLILLYGDGSTTIAAVITDYLRVLATKPDVQNAIYQEIENKMGTERLPTHEDKHLLPFTNSVIKELERKLNMASAIPSLECNRDTTVSGIFVPKGTLALINFYAIHNDPEVYKQPEEFDPRRFLHDDKSERSKMDFPVLFGLGRRACAGEPLVNTEIFAFLTAIIQKFTLQQYKAPEEGPSILASTEIQETLSFRALASPRNRT